MQVCWAVITLRIFFVWDSNLKYARQSYRIRDWVLRPPSLNTKIKEDSRFWRSWGTSFYSALSTTSPTRSQRSQKKSSERSPLTHSSFPALFLGRASFLFVWGYPRSNKDYNRRTKLKTKSKKEIVELGERVHSDSHDLPYIHIYGLASECCPR